MGLDVYVGSLTRYYSRDWEIIAQQLGRQIGMKVVVERHNEAPDAVRDPIVIREAVLAWRRALSTGLEAELARPLEWDESPESPYFTDKPGWDCYSDLLLWAAYEEHPQFNRPDAKVEDFSTDPAYQASNEESFNSRYPSLLGNLELWLPCEFSFTFRVEDAGGNKAWMGSSVQLLTELRTLNDRTWKADPATASQWRNTESMHGTPLESGGRFAFSILLSLAEKSVLHRLPMKLDY